MSNIVRIVVKTILLSLLFIFVIIPISLTYVYVLCNIGWEPPHPPRCQWASTAAQALVSLPFTVLYHVAESICNLFDSVGYVFSPKCAPAGNAVESYATGAVYGPCDYGGSLQVSNCVLNRYAELREIGRSFCVASDGRYAVFIAEALPEPRGCGARANMQVIWGALIVVDLRTGDAVWTLAWLYANSTDPLINGLWPTRASDPAALSRYIVFGEDGVYLRNATGPYIVISRGFYTAKVSIDKLVVAPSRPVEQASGVFIKVPSLGR